MKKKLERKTKSLIVRPYQASDYLAWKQAFSTTPPKQNTWDKDERTPDELTRANFTQLLKEQKNLRTKDVFYTFGVFRKKDGALVGSVNLMDVTRHVFQNAYLGYRIFNRYWGQGFGKEAVAAAMDIAFKDLNLHRLEAAVEPKNKRSIALAKSIGLRKEGLSKKRLLLRGKWVDLLLFVTTTEDQGVRWRNK